jgi:hypothetical protein
MNKQSIRIILLSAALAMVAVGVTDAKPKSKGVAAKSAPFSVTGVYSGTLDGEVVVNGQSVFITNQTSFHKVGKGPVEKGESLSKTAVMISGVTKGKKAIATMVLIGERETTDDYSQATLAGAEDDSNAKRAR